MPWTNKRKSHCMMVLGPCPNRAYGPVAQVAYPLLTILHYSPHPPHFMRPWKYLGLILCPLLSAALLFTLALVHKWSQSGRLVHAKCTAPRLVCNDLPALHCHVPSCDTGLAAACAAPLQAGVAAFLQHLLILLPCLWPAQGPICLVPGIPAGSTSAAGGRHGDRGGWRASAGIPAYDHAQIAQRWVTCLV